MGKIPIQTRKYKKYKKSPLGEIRKEEEGGGGRLCEVTYIKRINIKQRLKGVGVGHMKTASIK